MVGIVKRTSAMVLAAALSACSAPPTRAPAAADDVPQGKALYSKYCALCHGPNAEGYAADNANQLANPTFLATVSNTFLFGAIDQGRSRSAMGAYGKRYGGPLERSQIHAIMRYLRSLHPGKREALSSEPVAGDAQRGAEVYAKRCGQCHGKKGLGGSAPSIAKPLFLATASDHFLRYAIAKGRPGTPMPAFEGSMDATTLNNLTAYLRSLAQTVPGRKRTEAPPAIDKIVIHSKGQAADLGPLRAGRYVPAARVAQALKEGRRMVLVDARPLSDWMQAHIPGSIPIPYYDTASMFDRLPKDGTWIVSYCACPHAASGRVMDALRQRGFKNTAVIDEGILHWIYMDYPSIPGRSASGSQAPKVETTKDAPPSGRSLP